MVILIRDRIESLSEQFKLMNNFLCFTICVFVYRFAHDGKFPKIDTRPLMELSLVLTPTSPS
jgi:S-adenosylmethionine:diacylglycerol 3-amino-3-carboxypropyl transferase